MRCLNRERGCVCCKTAYSIRPPAVIDHVNFNASFSDKGLHDLLFRLQAAQFPVTKLTNKLEPSTADEIACYGRNRARQVARCQDPVEREAHKRLIAPFAWEELELGSLLGIGGFSCVFEIKSFHPGTRAANTSIRTSSTGSLSKRTSSMSPFSVESAKVYDQDQKKARQFLAQHSMRPTVDLAGDFTKSASKQVARYAVKHLRSSLVSSPELFARAAIDLVCEAEIMLSLNHPNIVKLRGLSTGGPDAYREGEHNSYFLIVDRLVETLESRIVHWRKKWKKERSRIAGVSLLKRLHGKKRAAAAEPHALVDKLWVDRMKVAYDVSGALEHLHEKHIVYRDLKPTNIGFDFRGDVKLFDFGLSRYLPSSTAGTEATFHLSNVGTMPYIAPEVTGTQRYNLKVDVFSMGVTFWEMLTMCSPPKTRGAKKNEPRVRCERMASCPCWPSPLQCLVPRMLSKEPKDRPTTTHCRNTLKEILVDVSDSDVRDKLMDDEDIARRRRSTYRLEACDLNELDLKDLVEIR